MIKQWNVGRLLFNEVEVLALVQKRLPEQQLSEWSIVCR